MSNLQTSFENAHSALSSAADYQVSTWAAEANNTFTGVVEQVNAFVNGVAANWTNGFNQVLADWGVWSDALHTAATSF